MIFLCPQLTKSRLPLDFGSFLPSFAGHLHCWASEGNVHKKRFPAFITALIMSLSANYQTGGARTRKRSGPRSCCVLPAV